jgi:HlyD family secretion protein
MKRLFIILSFIVSIGAAIGVSYYVFSNANRNGKELILYGNVDVRQVDIGFRVAGQISELCFEEGDWVPKGSLMTRLDQTPYNSQVRLAAANVEAIKVNLKNAEILLNRRLNLIDVGGVSQEDLDDARANRDALAANLTASEAELQVALDNLGYTEAFCPTDGTILTRIREPGSVLQPSEPVYTLSVASPVWIRAYVEEPDLGNIYYGMSAEIFTDTKGRLPYKGKIGFISPVSEFTPKTVQTTSLRTDLVYRLRIYVDNPDHFLKQGMPVTVKLNLEKNQGCPSE